MSEKIEPALSRPAWKHESVELSDGAFVSTQERDGLYVWLGGKQEQELVGADRHALAALALHGQPFGFTREDVAYLRMCATTNDDGYPYLGGPDENLMSIANRLAVLLPPE